MAWLIMLPGYATICISGSDVKSSEPIKESGEVYYPGELALHTMIENKELGIPVVEEIWEEVLHM